MKICLLIPDGVGIRNYLYSDVIPIFIQAGHEVVLWHSLDEELIQKAEDLLQVSLEKYPFIHQPNGIGVQFLREAGRFGRIRLNAQAQNNPTILSNWSGASSSFKGKMLNMAAELFGAGLTTYEKVAKTETLGFDWIRSSKEFSESTAFLKSINPDLLFCTHQRVFSVTAAIEAAKSLDIPTSTAIFSWDNLPKGRLPFRTDQYLVWSNHMKEELVTYYPEIAPDKVVVTGSPQFDFYFKKDIVLDRKDFAEKYGLNPEKVWICFSGCDTLTSPNDPLYLRDVALGLSDQEGLQLIFRPVPVEKVDRYRSVLSEFPQIKLLEPQWIKGSHWGNFFPLYEDIELLVNMAFHCKVVVNMGSTMALDFSTFGNVGLYLRYDHANGRKNWSVDTIFKFQHFRSMGTWRAVGYVNSPDEILSQTLKAVSSPDEVAPDRQLWFDRIVGQDLEKSSASRIADALMALSKRKN